MNRQKKTEYNRLLWKYTKIAFWVGLALTFMSVDSILTGFGI